MQNIYNIYIINEMVLWRIKNKMILYLSYYRIKEKRL